MTEPKEPLVSGIATDPRYRERYPWHAEVWVRLTQDWSRLPHALLLHGPAGLGKRPFALRLAQSLLCATPGVEAQACGTCVSCRRFAAGTHPDLLCISPVEDSATIAIDQIRSLRDFIALTPHTSARKVAILEPAEAMNLNAANALLKLLEEPPAGNLLFLITPCPARLPPTIRSRCVHVPFRPPARSLAIAWLSQQGAEDSAKLIDAAPAPLQALALAQSSTLKDREQVRRDLDALSHRREDPLRCAVRWKSYGLSTTLSWIQEHVVDLIRRRMAEQEIDRQVRELFAYLDLVSDIKALLGTGADEALVLEDLLVRWVRTSASMD